MASSSNLELALKITADAKQATAALQETQTQIKGVEQAAGGATNSAQRYTQQMSALQNSSRQAAQQAKNTADALALMAQIDPTAGKLDKLDALEASLNKLHNAGAIGADDFARMGDILEAQRSKIVGVGEAAVEGAAGMHAFSLNTSQARLELGRMLKDLATGQYSRLGQSSLTLANYTGVMGKLFSATAVAVTALVAELALFGYAAETAQITETKLNKALAETGNSAGLTFGSFQQLASEIAGSNAQMSKAQDVLLALAANGKVGQESFRAMGQAAMDMSQVTGASAEKAAQAVTQMFDGSVQSLLKANDQWHFLDATVLAHIESLKQVGDEEGAAMVAAEAFHDAVGPRIQEMTDQTYGLAAAWQSVKTGVESAWQEMKTGLSILAGTADRQTQIYALMGKIDQETSGSIGSSIGNFLRKHITGGTVADDQAKLAQLQSEQDAAQADADKKAAQGQLDSQGATGVEFLNQTLKQYADRETQRKDKIAEIHQQANAAIKDALSKQDTTLAAQLQQQEQQAIAEVNARFTPKAKKGPDLGHLQGNADVAAVQDSLAIITNAYKNADAQLAALRKNDQISDQQYYDGLRADLDKYVTDRTAALEKEKAEVLAHATTQAQRIEANQKAAQIDAEITKTQQDAATKRMQIDADEKASIEKTAQAWLDLQASLGLPVDVNTAKAMKKLQDLYDLLQKLKDEGKSPSEAQVDSMVGAALTTGVEKSPRLRSLRNIPGENNRDNPLALVDQDRQNENAAYAKQQAQLAANYAASQKQYQGDNQKLLQLQQQYQKESEMYANQHKDAMVQITQAEYWGRLQVASDLLGQLATLSNSQNKKVAAVGKAAAIAQAMINTYASAVAAYKAGVSVGGPAAPAIGAAYAAVAIAAGLANVAQIRAQGTGGGYQAGGWTGNAPVTQVVGVVHGREGVLSAPEVQAIGGEAGFNRLRKAIRGYADGGYVSPFDNAPSPADLGFNMPSMPRVQMQAAGAREAAARQQSIKVVAVWDREQAAHEVMKSQTGQKVIVQTVGDNPRAIQGKWAS